MQVWIWKRGAHAPSHQVSQIDGRGTVGPWYTHGKNSTQYIRRDRLLRFRTGIDHSRPGESLAFPFLKISFIGLEESCVCCIVSKKLMLHRNNKIPNRLNTDRLNTDPGGLNRSVICCGCMYLVHFALFFFHFEAEYWLSLHLRVLKGGVT
jgi:hypothetical protein